MDISLDVVVRPFRGERVAVRFFELLISHSALSSSCLLLGVGAPQSKEELQPVELPATLMLHVV
jgi:hypothetical protein